MNIENKLPFSLIHALDGAMVRTQDGAKVVDLKLYPQTQNLGACLVGLVMDEDLGSCVCLWDKFGKATMAPALYNLCIEGRKHARYVNLYSTTDGTPMVSSVMYRDYAEAEKAANKQTENYVCTTTVEWLSY